MSWGDIVTQGPGEVGYHVRLTPPAPVRTHDEVRAFLADVRRLFLRWRQSWGLGAGCWVAEVVRARDGGWSDIPCPLRGDAPDLSGWADLDGGTDAVDCVALAQRACQSGGECYVCGGMGVLPAVHLHVHAVVWARPFWFGSGAAPQGAAWEDFGGKGWRGFISAFNQGNDEVQPVDTQAGLAAYLSKACLHYLAGVAGKKGEVDWRASFAGAALASAVYGRERHRGALGRAYGVRVDDVGTTAPVLRGSASPLGQALAGSWGVALERRRFDAKCAPPREVVQRARLGRKAAARLLWSGTGVPKATQVDGGSLSGAAPGTAGQEAGQGLLPPAWARALGGASERADGTSVARGSLPVRAWRDVRVVDVDECWSMPLTGGRQWVARGAAGAAVRVSRPGGLVLRALPLQRPGEPFGALVGRWDARRRRVGLRGRRPRAWWLALWLLDAAGFYDGRVSSVDGGQSIPDLRLTRRRQVRQILQRARFGAGIWP